MARLRVGGIIAAVGLAAGWLLAGATPAGAVLPAHTAPCSWSFGPDLLEGAAGTLVIHVQLVPATPAMSCIETVAVTAEITDAAGGVPAGITSDGGTSSLVLLFSSGELPSPGLLVSWGAYCTFVTQSVYLHIGGGGRAAVYPLGASRPCAQGPGPNSAVAPPKVESPNPAVGLAPASSGGYRIATTSGTVVGQPGGQIEGGLRVPAPFVGIAAAGGGGFWMVAADGSVYSFGAPFYGSAAGLRLSAPIVGMASTATRHGYWLVGADGGIFAFGDAGFHGSAGALHLSAPVVGMAPTKDGGGYWLAAADGGVFTYGDARFEGSAGAIPLAADVVGIAADAATGGYWLGAGDGGVFAFHAPFHGSAGALHLAAPVTAITATPDSGGYWLLGGDGGVFTYGDAPYQGSGQATVGAG